MRQAPSSSGGRTNCNVHVYAAIDCPWLAWLESYGPPSSYKALPVTYVVSMPFVMSSKLASSSSSLLESVLAIPSCLLFRFFLFVPSSLEIWPSKALFRGYWWHSAWLPQL